MKRVLWFAGLIGGVVATASLAQHAGHPGPSTPVAKGSAAKAPSTKEYIAANNKMHKDMAIPYSGNADADFVNGMIPHHQGAIDMAKVVLAHGKDTAISKLASEIIKAQEVEIAQMRAWLKQNSK